MNANKYVCSRISFRAWAFFLIILTLSSLSCKKYLEKKSNQSLVIPSTIGDFQALLDFYQRINHLESAAGEVSADNYYISSSTFSTLNEFDRRKYIWEKDHLFPEGASNDWANLYANVYRANVVLEDIDNVDYSSLDESAWRAVKGHALFLRAKSLFDIAIIWALAYDSSTASVDLGIPLRLNPEFNSLSKRANVQQTYDQIIQDLIGACSLLPTTAVHVYRPSKPAAYALLSRLYLSMRKYDSCYKYSDLCLQLRDSLYDYNNASSSGNFTIPNFNPEVLYNSIPAYAAPISYTNAKVDSLLYNSYTDTNDLRKLLFFKKNADNTYSFGNSYYQYNLFSGVAVDEVYLMKAECLARQGIVTEAINVLNTLLIKRWKTGTYIPYVTIDSKDALDKILLERRKELIMRCLRWMDIKRLNKEGANIILERLINGQSYTLLPNDPKYALPIPEDVISISGMPQNLR